MFIYTFVAIAVIALATMIGMGSASLIIGITVFLIMVIVTEAYIIRKTGDIDRVIIPGFLLTLLAIIVDLYFRMAPDSENLPTDVWIIVAFFIVGVIALAKRKDILSCIRSRPQLALDNQ
ncbi:MAG: hypothetical protein WC386_00975 [Candidatus Paceibacterota bacterium]